MSMIGCLRRLSDADVARLGYVLAHDEALRGFVAGAAESGEAMLVYVV